ncbi:unnamed protein product [Adineta steineri]|uniref:Uncharacterized protein n=1 Tax=Adineta steineri TaxID=433720 RepID=A0A814GVF5_9BILA|nr:unnamed protein product [Adineta steineri]
MASATTEEHVGVRHVDENTLSSVNLKQYDNFDEYIVLIVGIDDNQYLFKNLPLMISRDRIQSFDDIATSLRFIRSQSNINIFLIISGTLGQKYAHQFVLETQIIGLYIYCMDETEHAKWAKEIEKIRCIVSNPTKLIIQLHSDIKKLSGRWPFAEKSFEKASTDTSQWYHLFLLVICYRSESIKLSYQNMFKECREYYQNNYSIIKQIDEFAQTYKPTNAIYEYTRDTFLYRIVNHALRTQNMKLITVFSPFIRDLHSQIYDYHRIYYRSNNQFIRSVYRGQNLSPEQLNHLISIWKSNTSIITLTTFGSTTVDPDVALDFVPLEDGLTACLFEIIITDSYNDYMKMMTRHVQVFANITSLSHFPQEQEVLFSLVTHFRIQHIAYRENRSDRPWVLITLELVTGAQDGRHFRDYDIIDLIGKVEDPQIYTAIIDMLVKNAEDDVTFNTTNWSNWWKKLNSPWSMSIGNQQPLNLTFYDCFTNNKYWSRKAIDMHKTLLRSIPVIESNRSSFSYLLRESNVWLSLPTRWVALYEEYLEHFCIVDTKEVATLLKKAGQMYEKTADTKCALDCYEKILKINVNDKYGMNNYIQNQIEKLLRPPRPIRTRTDERRSIPEDRVEEVLEVYEMMEDLRLIYRIFKECSSNISFIKACVEQIYLLLIRVEKWYDAADSRIILRFPHEEIEDLSVNDYRLNFLLAAKTHILSPSTSRTDGTNNRSLSCWRYKKYMYEYVFIGELKQCLQLFQSKSIDINYNVFSRIDRLMKKLSVLIAICTVYICTESASGKVMMGNIKFINVINAETKQHIFFDLHNSNLLIGLETLEEQSSITKRAPVAIPDDMRIKSMNISDFY